MAPSPPRCAPSRLRPPCARALTPDSGCSQGSVMVGRLVLTRLVTLDCLPLHTTSGNAFSKSSSFGASCGRVSVEDEEEAKAVRRHCHQDCRRRHHSAPGAARLILPNRERAQSSVEFYHYV